MPLFLALVAYFYRGCLRSDCFVDYLYGTTFGELFELTANGQTETAHSMGKRAAMIPKSLSTVSHNGKVEHRTPMLSRHEQRLQILELTVQLLIARTGFGDYWSDGLMEVRNLLASLRLPPTELATANRHLQNAVDYCQQGEFGAATFELRALRGQLQRL
jgi:hypothetical protein